MTDLPPPASQPPAGWYPDPTTGGRGFRWWDGVIWTEQWSERPEVEHHGLVPIGEWMNELLRIVSSRAGHFFTLIALLIVPITLINGIAGYYALHGLVFINDTEAGTLSITNAEAGPGTYAIAALTSIAALIASVAMILAATRQGWGESSEQAEPWSDSLRGALRRMPGALGNLFVVGAVLFVLYLLMVVSLAISAGLLLFTIPIWVVGTAWFSARFSLTSPLAALAPAGVRCLPTTWALTKDNLKPLFGRMALLLLFSVSLFLLMRILTAPLMALVGEGEAVDIDTGAPEIRMADIIGDNPAAFAIGQLFNGIGSGISLVLWSVGFALVYRDLRGPVDAADE